MNKGVIIGIVVVLAVVLALPFVARLGKDEEGVDTKAASPARAASKPAPKSAPTRPQPIAPPRPIASPQLNAQNIVGSVWEYEGYTLQFQGGGQASVYLPGMTPGPNVQGIPAKWSVTGAQLKIEAMGQTIEAKISGNQLLGPEGPIRRVR